MKSANQFQIVDLVVCVSLRVKTFEEDVNLSLQLSAMGK